MEQRSEPTTELIKNFRGACIFGITSSLEARVIKHLKSQQREIERHEDNIGKLMMSVDLVKSALNAEKARADAAVADMKNCCQFCAGYEREENEPPCDTCFCARTFAPDDIERTENWTWRGEKGKANT